MVHDQVLPTQKPSVMSLHLHQQSAIAGRRLGRQEICQEVMATEGSFNTQSSIAYREDVLSTSNMVPGRMTLTQKPSMVCLRVNQASAMGGRRFGRQEICQERSQQTRRHGVCTGSDGSQDQQVFVRVLNKRF